VIYGKAILLAVSWYCWSAGNAQAADQRCGAIALSACMKRLGRPTDTQTIAERLPRAGEYSSLSELADAACEWSPDRLCEVVAAGLFVVSGFMVWHSRIRVARA
jgi:hypothetical protein